MYRIIGLLLLLLPAAVLAQSYEEGYIIDNMGNRLSCLLASSRNVDEGGKYSILFEPDGEPLKADVSYISEFGIEGKLKFSRGYIQVDISSGQIYAEADTLGHAEYYSGHVFLSHLLESDDFTFYYYFYQGKEYFFYQKDSAGSIQLRYKEYQLVADDRAVSKVLTDQTYKKQLEEDFPCSAEAAHVYYTRNSLLDYFTAYIDETGGQEYLAQRYKPVFNMQLSLSFNRLSCTVKDGEMVQKSFGPVFSPGIGTEAAIMLPFNRNAMGIFASVNFLSMYAEDTLFPTIIKSALSIRSLEFPVGIKWNVLSGEKMKMYARVGIVPNYIMGSSYVSIDHPDYSYKLQNVMGLMAGGGLSYKRISADVNWYSDRNLTAHLYMNTSRFKQLSFRISYRFAGE